MRSLTLLILLSLAHLMSAQSSTLGTDFWVTFMNMRETETSPSLTLIVSGKNSCTGRVENPNTGWYEDFSVTGGSITNVAIPLEQAYTTASGSPTGKGLHIITTDTVSVFASNYKPALFDASIVYPTTALMDEYMVQSYRGAYGCTSEFVIIATEDNTKVEIKPTANSTSNNDGIITNIYANSTFTTTLNTGQCFLLKANSPSDDLSGSQVKALDCKKIAVFQGVEGVQIPYGSPYMDLLFEQSVPTAYWGRRFILTASLMRTVDRVKVTSLNDNCQIKIDGVTQATIMKAESYMFELTPDTPAIYMETTQPVCTYLYFTGGEYGGYYGDPSSALINPIEQQIDDITFPTFTTDSTQYHFVNIVTETDKAQGITLDGINISDLFSPVSGNPKYSYARAELSHGSHNLKSEVGGFVAHIYGLGPHESYSYSAGSAATNLNEQIIVNGIAEAPGREIQLCTAEDISFDITANFNFTLVSWDFGDGESSATQTTSHYYPQEGRYEVCAIIERETADHCSGQIYDTIRNAIVVNRPKASLITVTSCDSYEWNGNTYYESGDYEYTTTQLYADCDSVAKLHLVIHESYQTEVFDTTCNAIYQWNGLECTQQGDYEANLSTINNCDSLVTLHLNFIDMPEVEINGPHLTIGGDEVYFTEYEYTLISSASIDSVMWQIDCDNWQVLPIGNGETCLLHIHSFIPDSTQFTATVFFDCGQTTTSIWIQTSFYGIDENTLSAVSLTPNPTNGLVNINVPNNRGIQQLKICNLLGSTVLEVAKMQGNTIDVSSLSAGVYIVRVVTTNGKENFAKLVKK